MMQIKYTDIPYWLEDSCFYRNLSSHEPNSCIDIPAECFRATDSCVHSVNDQTEILKTMRFWGVRCFPWSVLEFCYAHDLSTWDAVVMDLFGEGMVEHRALRLAFSDPQLFSLEVALMIDRYEFVDFWLHKNDPNSEHGRNAVAQACRFGRLDLVQTLHEKGFSWDTYAYCAAALCGHRNVLQYLYTYDCPCEKEALVFAARGGQLECMKYLRSIGCEWDPQVTLGRHHLQQMPFEHLPWSDEVPLNPAVSGYSECLQFALENGCPIDQNAIRRVCEYGELTSLQLLVQFEATLDTSATAIAAEFGHLDCLQFLHEHGCPWDELTYDRAAQNGDLSCLQYLHEHNCPWDDFTPAMAAGSGQLACLQYLCEHGCPWHERSINLAALSGSFDCLLYFLTTLNCPCDAQTARNAATGGSLDCLELLFQHSCVWDQSATKNAAGSGHLDCLRFLHSNGCPWEADTAISAARGGHAECLTFALENGCIYKETELLTAAAGSSNVACLQYLVGERGLRIYLHVDAFAVAFAQAHVANVEYLLSVGCPFQSYTFKIPMFHDVVKINDRALLQCIKSAVAAGWQFNRDLYDFIHMRCLLGADSESGEEIGLPAAVHFGKATDHHLPLCLSWKIIIGTKN